MKEAILQFERNRPTSFLLDTLAKSIYITFSTKQIAKTVRKNSSLSIDYDKDGEIVGIEIIRIKKAQATFKRILKDAESYLPSASRRALDNYIQAAQI